MPLVRVQVRNEYGLGMPELYGETNREDPKAVLDGVAVSGLVGLLRQLGDLAEFAAEVFHFLQEQMVTTASRSHKLMVRVQHIEAALPPLEKTILTQKSHLHFAYTAGSRWHTCIQNEQNHFIYDDLPRFIMDSYEECRNPPRLPLLDKFDTGGPGSCSKRYSDPTFFKKASVSPDEANSVKVPRDKKVQRSKKKRMRQRNGEVSHGASVSSHSGRMQFTSLNIDDQQTSWTVSTFDDTLKSDMREQPNSFDSRIGSGDIECIFHPSYCVESGEYVGTKESSPCMAKMQHNDSLDSAFVDKQSIIIDDGLPQSLTQEQIGPSSSFVTWDEKIEIVELTNQQYDSDETPEKLPTVFDADTQERRTVISESVGQMDYHSDNEKTPKSFSGGNHKINDIESETDNYMDALNSIGSESEIDLDCQIKQEVPEYSNLSGRTEDGLLGIRAHQSDHHPLNFESQTATSSSLNKGASWEKPNLGSLESYAQEQSPQMEGSSSNLSKVPVTDLCGNADILDGSSIEPVISNISSYSVEPNTDAQMSDELISSSCESRKSPTEPSGPRSVKLWTNGGLLGLEPSKPPDCGTMNSASQDPVTTNEDYKIGSSNQSNILRGNEHAGDDASSQPKIVSGNGYAAKLGTLMTCSDSIEYDLSSKCSTSYHDDQQDNISTKNTSGKFSQADLGVKLEKSGDLHCTSRFSHAHGYGFNGTGVSTEDPKQPGTPDITSLFNEACQEDGNNSSQMFGIGHGLLVNGFQRKVSHIQVEDFEPTSFVKTDVSERKSSNRCVVHQTSSGTHFNKHVGERHPVNSPSSSPPIEHMKMSFQPINGFETSKLTLKFLDHDHRHESSKDTFPSFQLVPEPLISLHDDGSDFDDDISCRSSPYMSDDCLSLHSESNSGQWESAKTLGNNDQNTSYKITPMESVFSSLDLGRTALGSFGFDCELKSPYAENVVEPSQSDHLLDLPSFDVADTVFKQEMKNAFDAKDLPDLRLPNEPSPPPPPPLPPLQWRAMKSLSDVAEDKRFTESDACNHVFDMKILQPTITLQIKPSPVKQQKNSEEDIACALRIKENEQQKLNRPRKVNQLTIDNGKAGREDFLNQIRTKSFSLRRTVTTRQASAPTPEPTNNVKVTAILEKANAIRQAVRSDNGGDDDNWSDT